jgi:Flp pilus assembly protein TadD
MNWLTARLSAAHLGLVLLAGLAGCAERGTREADLAARLRVASVAEASGQPEIAVSVLAALSAAAPENIEVQTSYARALIRVGNLVEAEAAAMQALRRRPGDPALLGELGRIRLLEGKPTEALEAFQAVLRANPRNVAAGTGRGIALDLLGEHDQAQASYRAALLVDPQNLAALNNLALSMVLADRPREAIAVLAGLARRSDAPERVRNNLAVAEAAAVHAEPARDLAESLSLTPATAPRDVAASAVPVSAVPARRRAPVVPTVTPTRAEGEVGTEDHYRAR